MTDDIRSLRVAVLQHNAKLSGPDERFAWLDDQLRKLQDQDIDLVVCPELFMSGYDVGDDILRYAEPADGNFACRAKTLAQQVKTAIVYGYPERDQAGVFNSAIAISADGSTLANHRKSVLPPGFEQRYFQTGSNLTLFTLKSVRVAILICYESEFPESVRNVSAHGAEVVVVPTAIVSQWDQVAYKVIPARAFENGVFLAYANHSGCENQSRYHGASCIVDPTGHEMARGGQSEEILLATLDLKDVAAAQSRIPFLTDCSHIPKHFSKCHVDNKSRETGEPKA